MPFNITPELYDRLVQGGIAIAVVAIVALIVIVMLNSFKPLIAQVADGIRQNSANFDTVMKYNEVSQKGLELLAERLQRALDREEASNETLKIQILEYTRLIARMETELEELKTLREKDQSRIKELESQQILDREAIEGLRRQLQTRQIDMDLLSQELEQVKKDRQKVAEERDRLQTEIATLTQTVNGLNERLSVQEEATKTATSADPKASGAESPAASSAETQAGGSNEPKAD